MRCRMRRECGDNPKPPVLRRREVGKRRDFSPAEPAKIIEVDICKSQGGDAVGAASLAFDEGERAVEVCFGVS